MPFIKTYNSFFLLIFLSFLTFPSFAQNPNIDVQAYHFKLKLNDANDTIRGRARISFKPLKHTDNLIFDLVSPRASGKGMLVDSVLHSGQKLKYRQDKDHLFIANKHDIKKISIYYHGVPADGLIIGKNKFGDRTFFGDNWPNRAHHWLPCIDHPSDKALVEFTVNAPSHYQVVSNGELIKKDQPAKNRAVYNYKSEVVLPTKVMVIGAAEFAVKDEGKVDGVPLYTWVYPENKEEGFHDYAPAKSILDYFTEKIGTFPFSKLANVQSTTRYGGMENAGAIFYGENTVTGKGEAEPLLAHEIAHQWFGDSASESDWPQLWLSEGFATYLADLYLKHEYGEKRFRKRLRKERRQVLAFNKTANTPIIDTSRTDLTKLLNPNSYQKGAWVLHMLRNKIGDRLFWKGIRAYYQAYQFKNANSQDLQRIFEKTSGENLETFFSQWLHSPEHPVLNCQLTKKQELKIEQNQNAVFVFQLDVKVNFTDGTSEIKTFEIDQREQVVKLFQQEDKSVKSVEIDPLTNLLFAMKNQQSPIIH